MLLASCGTSPSTGQPKRLQIIAAFYPFAFVATRVAGTQADVTNLTQPGAEPHDLELTPRQIGALSDADLVIYQKGLQPAVDDAVAEARPRRVIDVAAIVPLRNAAAEEAGHEDEATAGHDHNALDPHQWLDPTNVWRVTDAVRSALSAADPARAATFNANATVLQRDLSALDGRFAAGLAQCRRTEFITAHEAFGYLAARYGLTQIGIAGLTADAEPSAARIAEVQRIVHEHGITTIFFETLSSPEVAQSIAADLGLRTDVLDPLEGITRESRGTDYVTVMDANLTALRKANQCR